MTANADSIRGVVTECLERSRGMAAKQLRKRKKQSGRRATAEAITVGSSSLALAGQYSEDELRATDIAGGIVGAVVSDPVNDSVVWREYLEGVVADRADWGDFYEACRALDS